MNAVEIETIEIIDGYRIDTTSGGQRHGRLVTTGRTKPGSYRTKRTEVRCDCGTVKWVLSRSLSEKSIRSCGCLQRDTARLCMTKHGQYKTRIYQCWEDMIARCENASTACFHRYGGRGIAVCQQWRSSFTMFAGWANANGYSDDLTLDRIRVDGHYEPNNCRWATTAEQSRNKSDNFIIEAFGERRCLQDPRCSVNGNTVARRIRVLHMDTEQAITSPRMTPRGKI